MKKQNYLIHVTGATCSGKTSLAIVLGEFFKTEIISFDSRQFYKKMNIGTSVPNKMELKKCKHHFINSIINFFIKPISFHKLNDRNCFKKIWWFFFTNKKGVIGI